MILLMAVELGMVIKPDIVYDSFKSINDNKAKVDSDEDNNDKILEKYDENPFLYQLNEIPFKDFQNELDKNDTGIDFYKTIYPKIVRIVRITGGAAKGKMNFLNKLIESDCYENIIAMKKTN